MTGVLDVMLVIGIVDNALQVALLVAHLHFQFKCIVHNYFIVELQEFIGVQEFRQHFCLHRG